MPFYSIVKVVPNPSVGEMLAVGLLLIDGNRIFFTFSDYKIQQVIRPLLSNAAFSLLQQSLQSIGRMSKKQSSSLSGNPFTEEYLTYLSRYSNNLLQFSAPIPINIPANETQFKKLFDKIVGSYEPVEKPNTTYELIKEQLYPKIKEFVNIDIEINAAKMPDILFPVKLNFIGKNGMPITGKIIDFETENHDNELTKYILFVQYMRKKKQEGKYFIIGDDAALQHHATWLQIKEENSFEVVPSNQIDKITTYLTTQNVHPFFPKA
ncbi:DUF3037 domain-containing protein [Sphingobacteriales bacterium UPWRP_1]|nr:hypothetical protein BVG80_08300 [Sphingobacteriales bacterium TSM_CSM]PSJ76141.1 DUF3037 domain-containing protein [Sphingobacteriales bacterium UPWRP_1]